MRYLKYILIYFLVLYASVCLAKLKIDKKEVYVGKIIQGNPISYVFVVKNTGDKPIKIERIIPD